MKRFEFVVRIKLSDSVSSYQDVTIRASGYRKAVAELKKLFPNMHSFVCTEEL